LGEVLAIADQILAGLANLHDAGLVHKDVKPANILRIKGVWKLADMGLTAHSGEPPSPSGTPNFWPPEGPLDRTADLYALGKTLYLLQTGEPLHDFPEFAAGQMVLQSNDRRSEAVRQIIVRACDADPARRFAGAAEFRRALAALQARCRRGRLQVFYAGAACLAAVILGGVWFTHGLETKNSQSPSTTPADEALGAGDQSAGRPLKIMDLNIYVLAKLAGNRLESHGTVGQDCYEAHLHDGLVVKAKLSQPAYAYIIAFQPDGADVVCYPEKEDEPPRKNDHPGYDGYELAEGEGFFVFAVVAGSEPLPSYKEWRASLGKPPWKHVEVPAGIVWRADKEEIEPLTAAPGSPRGKGQKIPGKLELAGLLEWLQKDPGVHTVLAEGFSVLPKRAQ
jgi:hypothetical protein